MSSCSAPAPPGCSAPASPASAACACCCSTTRAKVGREDPHLRRRALQLHQPRLRAGALPVRQPGLLPLGAGALHARRLHRAGAAPRHRLPREAPRPAVLRRLGRADHRHAAGRMRRRRGAALAALRRARCGRPRRASSSTPAAAASARAQLVVATGGLSIPKIGATDFGHRLARQFGHRIVEPRPALVPLTFEPPTWAPFVGAGRRVAARWPSRPARPRPGSASSRTCCSPTAASAARPCCRSRATGARRRRCASTWRRAGPGRCAARRQAQSRRQLGNELAHVPAAAPGRTWLHAAGLRPHAADAAGARPRPGRAGREPAPLADRARRHRRLAQGRGHARRRRHARTRLAEPCKAGACPACTSSARWST